MQPKSARLVATWHNLPGRVVIVPPSSSRRDGRVAEGARLESVFTRKGNVGSNPTLSATQSGLQRNPARLALKYANNARISQYLLGNPDCGECTAPQRRGSGVDPKTETWKMVTVLERRTHVTTEAG